MVSVAPQCAPTVRMGLARVRAGACSWADRSLVAAGGFYPKRTMSATDRLRWYCARLPLAEITATYRFPPTHDLAAQWAARTPDGFVFDVRAWSLLTGNPTFPDSLWADLHSEIRPSNRERRRLYPSHLPPDIMDECWTRFAHALGPLQRAGRLGAVILTYPGWFSPRPAAWVELADAARRLEGFRLAVELHHPGWFAGATCHTTLEFLEEHGMALVCLDGPAEGPRALPAVVAATAQLALVRLCGRRSVADEPWTWPYRYPDEELAGWVPRIADLAASADDVHILMDNGWRTDAVDGAGALLGMLTGAGAR